MAKNPATVATTATTTARTAQGTSTVKALVPVQYDLVSIAVGEVFEVREADLGQLLDVGAVAPGTSADTPAA